MVPIGLYEKVLPMDLIATYLLRALLSKDLERLKSWALLSSMRKTLLSALMFVRARATTAHFFVAPLLKSKRRVMKALRDLLDSVAPLFEKGGRFEALSCV